MQIPLRGLIKPELSQSTNLGLVSLRPRLKQECVHVCVCVPAPVCGGRRGEEYHLSVTFCMSSNVPCVFIHRPHFIESRCNLAEQGLASFYEQGNYKLKRFLMVLPKIIPQRLSWIQT